MTYNTVATFSQVTSLLMFIAMFAAVLVYALWPANGKRFDEIQRQSLDLDGRVAKAGGPLMSKREIDDVTGVETTGHEWDGIKELNKPLPRWWLLTFYACIVWAIGYMIAYPAWPTLTGYTKGMLGYSQRAAVAQELKAAENAQGGMRARLQQTPLEDSASRS